MDVLKFTREQLAQYILTKAKETSLTKIKSIILNENHNDDEIIIYDINQNPISRKQYIQRNIQAVNEYENEEYLTTEDLKERFKQKIKS